MIKGALALALMSTVGMGGMVTVSSNGDITTSYYVPPIVSINHGHKAPPPPPRVKPRPIFNKHVVHKPHKQLLKKEHKPAPPKAQKPANHPNHKPADKPKDPAKKGNSKGGKR